VIRDLAVLILVLALVVAAAVAMGRLAPHLLPAGPPATTTTTQ
jgi:hypothetical protein